MGISIRCRQTDTETTSKFIETWRVYRAFALIIFVIKFLHLDTIFREIMSFLPTFDFGMNDCQNYFRWQFFIKFWWIYWEDLIRCFVNHFKIHWDFYERIQLKFRKIGYWKFFFWNSEMLEKEQYLNLVL
jgi:hypothetical protein